MAVSSASSERGDDYYHGDIIRATLVLLISWRNRMSIEKGKYMYVHVAFQIDLEKFEP